MASVGRSESDWIYCVMSDDDQQGSTDLSDAVSCRDPCPAPSTTYITSQPSKHNYISWGVST